MFAIVVSPICNGGKLNRGGRIQRDGLLKPVNPFKPGNPFTPETDSSLDPSENHFGRGSCCIPGCKPARGSSKGTKWPV